MSVLECETVLLRVLLKLGRNLLTCRLVQLGEQGSQIVGENIVDFSNSDSANAMDWKASKRKEASEVRNLMIVRTEVPAIRWVGYRGDLALVADLPDRDRDETTTGDTGFCLSRSSAGTCT